MKDSFWTRLRKNSWSLFNPTKQEQEEVYSYPVQGSVSYGSPPGRARFSKGNDRSIVNSVYNRIAMDVATLNINQVKLDEEGRFESVVDSPLNTCLTLEANIDQTGRAFIQDIVMSLLDEGAIAVVPVDTSISPNEVDGYKIYSMRVAKIQEWAPESVKVRLYNDRTGKFEEIWCPKKNIAIIENPLYSVVNEPNSTLQRLIRKLNLLDVIDEQSSANKLDMIIQLPFTIKSQSRKDIADARRKQITEQLADSKYGIAYIDSTEKITQLNRPIENNLLTQIEYLTKMLYGQLGLTPEIMDGSANEQAMLNYNNRTIEPIIAAIVDEMKRKFLTKTARAQRNTIMSFRDPFRLVPVNNIAEIADKFTRNEIMSSNEIRQVIGMAPSKDPEADELRNKNLSKPNGDGDSPGGDAMNNVPSYDDGRKDVSYE